MNVRLRANEPASKLAERLRRAGGPLAVRDLDITNCFDVNVQQLVPLITECKLLQHLRCAACTIPPSDVLMLVMQRLPHLVEVEFSCLIDRTIVHAEISRLAGIACTLGCSALKLQRLYVEIGQEHNFRLLSTFLRCCPNASSLHVHLVCGEFHEAVRECHTLLEEHRQLDTFRFTSELHSPFQCDPPSALHFAVYVAVCANFTYQRSKNLRSCARLQDLAEAGVEPQTIPFQTALVAVEDQFTPEWLRAASITHDWRDVRQLCLVLFLPHLSTTFPAADGTYRDCLREFSTQLRQLVELNVSSFHFGPGIDVTAFFEGGWMPFLQSLSAAPCGFRSVLTLKCLATYCPGFKELDVRFESRGSFFRCAGCESETLYVSGFHSFPSPAFRNGLARLTLSRVHDAACLSFLECCRPVATLRLSYCPLELDYERMSRALAHSSDPICLILQHHLLRLDDTDLLENLHRFTDLQYLYLLLYTRLDERELPSSITCILRSLPQLKCLHVHYECDDSPRVLRTATWMRGPGGEMSDELVRGGPCFQSCSTATFIGLAKPLNRDFQPML
ncbi:hypothetical protein HPB52_023064 [Rhipicephalus sanguineus]|uniref:Uncharacterized protein n=1 Tax=Rhipicephalus sanguineus TaxID=34632 RepID=A0A9D4PKE1_RHISA|nr:hypothetical protein HPB52_023064 [Rhipicephalus sanguineus]